MIAYGFCGSFCTHADSLKALETLVMAGEKVVPVFSEKVLSTSTRFGTHEDLVMKAETLCSAEGIKSIVEAEEKITRGNIDCFIISPCTGNTLAKIAHGITDGTVTMAAKAQLRNGRPILIALASNDALGGNFKNIATLAQRKNVFFVPLGQDDPIKKPTSLVCDFKKIPQALKLAIEGKQMQPLLLK